MVRRAILAVVVAASGCAVVGGYDFEGYQVKQQPEIAKSDASATAADASAGDAPPCLPRTCSELHAECGKVPDGCDGQLDCGTCETGICGGGGRNKCGDDPCSPRSCMDLGASCGEISDTCGGTVQCGRCVQPETCGGGGMSKKCGCMPLTCPEINAECGMASDGCGHMIDCGACTEAGKTCAGNGTPNKCECANRPPAPRKTRTAA